MMNEAAATAYENPATTELRELAQEQFRNNLSLFGDLYVKNFNDVWPRVMRLAGVKNWFDAFAGTAAVIVGGGPSLDAAAIESLRRVKGRAMIVAVDAVYEELLAAGIVPDLVVTGDPQDHAGKFFRAHRNGTLVAACGWQSASVINELPINDLAIYSLYYPGHPVWDQVFEKQYKDPNRYGRIPGGATVDTMAAGLLMQMRALNIAVVGVDLSFEREADRRDGSPLLNATDINGKEVFTSTNFHTSRLWYRDHARQARELRELRERPDRHWFSDLRWVNCGGGILGAEDEFELMGLEDFAERFGAEKERNFAWELRKRLRR